MTEKKMGNVTVFSAPSLPSTNDELIKMLRENENLPLPCVCTAPEQTKGKGRRGRSFVSPRGGLYMSMAMPVQNAEEGAFSTPLAAVAVCRALEKLGVRGTGIKWVNDVYLNSRKICGILCEFSGPAVVIGMGVNLKTPEGGFPPEAGIAGAVDQKNADRETLFPLLTEEIQRAFQNKKEALEYYREHCILIGKEVVCQTGHGEVTGKAAEIDDQFGLVVETEKGPVTVRTGEVTKVRQRKAAAFFDFDGTMRKGDSIVSYVSFGRKKGLVSWRDSMKIFFTTLGYLCKILPAQKAKQTAQLFENKVDADAREKLRREFANDLTDHLYKQAREEWQKNKDEGRMRIILSASTDNYMKYVAQNLGADKLICTHREEDGSVFDNCHGKEKIVRAMKLVKEENIDLKNSTAYGDSGSDIYILKETGFPTAVNPKRKLKKQMKKYPMKKVKWEYK